MRHILLAATFGLITLLTGCNQFKEFSINEGLINDYLAKNVNYNHQVGLSGVVDADIQFFNLSTEIGRTEPNKIVLTGQAKITLDSLLGSTTAQVSLTLTSRPYFDVATGAIYLKDLTISSYKVTPENMDAPISAVLPYLNSSLQSFFEQQPVYVLNPDNSAAEATAKKLAKGLEVKPGKLVIPLVE